MQRPAKYNGKIERRTTEQTISVTGRVIEGREADKLNRFQMSKGTRYAVQGSNGLLSVSIRGLVDLRSQIGQ